MKERLADEDKKLHERGEGLTFFACMQMHNRICHRVLVNIKRNAMGCLKDIHLGGRGQ